MPIITIADSSDVITIEAVNLLSDAIQRLNEQGYNPTAVTLDTGVTGMALDQIANNVDAPNDEIGLTMTYVAPWDTATGS